MESQYSHCPATGMQAFAYAIRRIRPTAGNQSPAQSVLVKILTIDIQLDDMHMADALVSPAVAGVAGAVAVGLLAVAAKKVKSDMSDNMVPLMGVMGAFIFAAQMINFTIPGTGSSGHIVGGILLGAVLGPWAAFLTLTSVLVVQCLIFADGGLMALGCNIINMGALSTLVAYPLIYKPIAGHGDRSWRITAGAVTASVISLELGALCVTAETEMSGVTALPWKEFLTLMCSIHLFIGLGEGLATAAVLYFVKSYKPDLLAANRATGTASANSSYKKAAWIFMGTAMLLGLLFTWIASSYPDGLEWSIASIIGDADLPTVKGAVQDALGGVQASTSVLPDYGSTWSGVIGCAIVVTMVWILAGLLVRRKTAVKKL